LVCNDSHPGNHDNLSVYQLLSTHDALKKIALKIRHTFAGLIQIDPGTEIVSKWIY
jgi:hypothetical protein